MVNYPNALPDESQWTTNHDWAQELLAIAQTLGIKFSRNKGARLASGRYWNGLGYYADPVASAAFIGGRTHGYVFLVPETITFSALAYQVTTGAAGCTLQPGLFAADGPGGLPGTQLAAAAALDASTTGTKEGAITPVTIQPGFIWAMTQIVGGGAATRTRATKSFFSIGHQDNTKIAADYYVSATSVGSTLPSSLSSYSWSGSDGNAPHEILAKVA